MQNDPRRGAALPSYSWPLVLCLVGLDYFSTLAYLPSIAVEAAGPWAPVAAGVVVLVTFLLALPVYWYVVGRSSDGRGATGLLEDLIPGWRGKIVVLTLLGFAAADFVITRSLSVADAAIHLINNPHGQRLLARLPEALPAADRPWWPPLDRLLVRLAEPQVAITLGLSIISFTLLHVLKRGLTRGVMMLAATAAIVYLALSGLVIASALAYIARHREIWDAWLATTGFAAGPSSAAADASAAISPHAWLWGSLQAALWSFPQMALGLSGFEMIMTVVPQVSPSPASDTKSLRSPPLGGEGPGEGGGAKYRPQPSSAPVADDALTRARIRNTRKLMVAAAVDHGCVPRERRHRHRAARAAAALEPGGAAQHRALAYLAHGGALADSPAAAARSHSARFSATASATFTTLPPRWSSASPAPA